jgi:hypothetical protein
LFPENLSPDFQPNVNLEASVYFLLLASLCFLCCFNLNFTKTLHLMLLFQDWRVQTFINFEATYSSKEIQHCWGVGYNDGQSGKGKSKRRKKNTVWALNSLSDKIKSIIYVFTTLSRTSFLTWDQHHATILELTQPSKTLLEMSTKPPLSLLPQQRYTVLESTEIVLYFPVVEARIIFPRILDFYSSRSPSNKCMEMYSSFNFMVIDKCSQMKQITWIVISIVSFCLHKTWGQNVYLYFSFAAVD